MQQHPPLSIVNQVVEGLDSANKIEQKKGSDVLHDKAEPAKEVPPSNEIETLEFRYTSVPRENFHNVLQIALKLRDEHTGQRTDEVRETLLQFVEGDSLPSSTFVSGNEIDAALDRLELTPEYWEQAATTNRVNAQTIVAKIEDRNAKLERVARLQTKMRYEEVLRDALAEMKIPEKVKQTLIDIDNNPKRRKLDRLGEFHVEFSEPLAFSNFNSWPWHVGGTACALLVSMPWLVSGGVQAANGIVLAYLLTGFLNLSVVGYGILSRTNAEDRFLRKSPSLQKLWSELSDLGIPVSMMHARKLYGHRYKLEGIAISLKRT
jgi:hypothetical protein